MMLQTQKLSLPMGARILVILSCLSSLAWAAPRVAIVTPLNGEVKLGGVALKGARIAEEGQMLSLGSGGKARVQLLGSSKEKVLSGAVNYTISKAALNKDGRALSRGSLSVSEDIGNLARAAAGSTRPTSYVPVGLSLRLPPEKEGDGWVIPVATPLHELKVSKDNDLMLTISDLTDPTAEPVSIPILEPQTSLPIEREKMVVGHQYLLQVQRGMGAREYARRFRILTPEEQDALAETERVYRQEATGADAVPVLVRLAGLYESFDQVEKVTEVLEEVVNHPQFKDLDETTRGELRGALNRARNSLDMQSYPAAS